MLVLQTSLELVEWNKANLGCCHAIGMMRKEDLKTGRFGIFRPRCNFLCTPSTASEGPDATDVGFGDFSGVGGVEQSQLGMLSCHWKDAKRRCRNRSF